MLMLMMITLMMMSKMVMMMMTSGRKGFSAISPSTTGWQEIPTAKSTVLEKFEI